MTGIVQPQQVRQTWQQGIGRRQNSRRRAVKRQLGRWHVLRKSSHQVEAAHLQRTQAFPQGAFQGVLPTLFDMQATPQALQMVEAMLLQPGLQLAVGHDLFLQCLERFEPGRQLGQLRRLAVHGLLLLAAPVVKLGGAVAQRLKPGLRHVRGFLRQIQLTLQFD